MKRLENGYFYDSRNHRIYSDEVSDKERNTVDDFHQNWLDRSAITKKRKARRVVLVLTNLCNLACSYCYAAQGDYGKDCIDKIKHEQILRTIEFLENQFPDGIQNVQFFGGEPMLETRAINSICNYMEESPTLINGAKGLVTNGTVLNDAIIEMLKKHNIAVTVSVDGTKKYHDLFRTFKVSGKGSYEVVIRNLRRLVDGDVPVTIELTISKNMVRGYAQGNLKPTVIAETFQRLGVRYVHMGSVVSKKDSKYAFTREDRVLLLQMERELMSEFHERHITENQTAGAYRFLTTRQCNQVYCDAGLDEITIDANGDIYPCFMFINKPDFLLGNVRDGITNDVLLNDLQNNVKENNSQCHSCMIKDRCSMCIGANYIENGDIHIPSRTSCSFQNTGYFKGVEQMLGDMKQ